MARDDRQRATTDETASREAQRGPSTPPPAAAGAGGRSRLGRLRSGAGAAAEPIVEGVGHVIGSAVGAASGGIRELPGMRVRRVRRMARAPLASLPELFPETRAARPVDVGVRTIAVDEIRGTAVGGGHQRGGDFLPLRDFRGRNWSARWQRLHDAQRRLATLPSIDVVKYDGGFWVVDGHNRVALALYTGQRDVDASVVELVPPGGRRSETIGSLAAEVEAARPMRSRVAGPGDGESGPS